MNSVNKMEVGFKKFGLDSIVNSCLKASSRIVCSGLIAASLIGCSSFAFAQDNTKDYPKPPEVQGRTFEQLAKAHQRGINFYPEYENRWDHYCDSTIREDMNIPLQLSYSESIPLVENGYTFAYLKIYAGFRNEEEQNMDCFVGLVGTGNSSEGNLKKTTIRYMRAVAVYKQGVYPEQEEEWSKEQMCFAQIMGNDSLVKVNLKSKHQIKLFKWDIDLEKKLFSSSSGLLKIAKSAWDLPFDFLNFVTMEALPGQLETQYGSLYREPIIAEEIYQSQPVAFWEFRAIKDIHNRLSWKSTRRRRLSKLYLEIKLQKALMEDGVLKIVDFGLGDPAEGGLIKRTLDIPQRQEEE